MSRELKFQLVYKNKIIGEVVFWKTWGGIPNYSFYVPVTKSEIKAGIISYSKTYLDEELAKIVMDCKRRLYTGLKDKNGKEIYEGDILNIRLYPNSLQARQSHDKGFRAEVIWSEGHWGWAFFVEGLGQYHHGTFFPSGKDESVIEIIGNRFENPELLGEPK